MYNYSEGQLLIPGKTNYNEESRLEYTGSVPMLTISVSEPSLKEIMAVKENRVELALYEKENVLWFLHKIHGFADWSDTPFSIRLYDDKGIQYDWPKEIIDDGSGLILFIFLIDSNTGIIKAMRTPIMPTKFSQFLQEAMLRQLEKPFSIEEYDQQINNTFNNYSSKDLLMRADIKCKID